MLNYACNEVISYIPSGISQIPSEYYTLFFGFFISGLLSVLFSPSSSKPEGRNSEALNYNIKIDVHEERNIHVHVNEEQRDEDQMNEEQRDEEQMNEEQRDEDQRNDERIYEGEENPYLKQCLSTISSICRASSVKELNDMKITDNHIIPLCEMLSGVKIEYTREELKGYFLALIRNDRTGEDRLLNEINRIYSLRDINTLNEENKKDKLVAILICSDLEFPRSEYKKKKEFILRKLYNCITCLD